MSTRQVKPSDVAHVAMQHTDRDDRISELQAQVEMLQKLCTAIVAELATPQQQLAMVRKLTGSESLYEHFTRVELTA